VRIDLNGIVITVSPSVAICQGASTTISASGGASTYTWSPAAGLSNPNIASPVATPSVTTVYTVIGTSPDGCADTNSVTVTVNPLPPVNAGPTALVCAGSTTTLSGSGASSYSWSPGTFLSSTNIPNPVVSPTTTITYTLTGTDLNGCVNSDTVSVIVLPIPTASAGSNTSICQGQSTVLAGSGGGTYSWGPTTGLSNPLIANPVATPTSTTTYTVTVTGSNGCTSPAQVTITVNPAPIATATASDFNICLGASTNLSAAGGVAYSWSPTAGLSNPNIANPTAMPGSSTMYIVTVSSSVGCTDTASVFITVNNTMSIGASTVTPETCGESNGVIVTGAITGGGAPYTYSINGGPAQSSNTFTGLLAGSYTITVTDNAGCSTTQVVNVGQVLGVNAAFTANPPSGASPLTVNFSNGSTGASNYIWDFGDGGNSLLNNPSNIYGTNGTYTVTLVAYNGSLACSDTATMTILVYDDVIITAPNIFTPNGDQTNDVFVIQSVGLKTLEGKMFNRWGREVGSWNGTGPNDGWDGKINGNTAEDGTYFFIINATGYDGKTYEEKGYVQVLGGK
jgi:gliding motility-associated-like protein